MCIQIHVYKQYFAACKMFVEQKQQLHSTHVCFFLWLSQACMYEDSLGIFYPAWSSSVSLGAYYCFCWPTGWCCIWHNFTGCKVGRCENAAFLTWNACSGGRRRANGRPAWLVIWTRHRFCAGVPLVQKPTKMIWYALTLTRLHLDSEILLFLTVVDSLVGPDVSPEFGSWLQLEGFQGAHVSWWPFLFFCKCFITGYCVQLGFAPTSWSQWWLAASASGNHFDFAVGLGCYFRISRSLGSNLAVEVLRNWATAVTVWISY